MPVVEIEDNGSRTKVDVPAGQTLLSMLRKAVPAYISPCGGNHTCGKCLVEAAGGLSGISEEERKLLPAGDRFRLACCVRILGDCYVRLPHRARKQTIAKAYQAELVPGEPLYQREYGAAVDIGTTTVVVYLFRKGEKTPAAAMGKANMQRSYGSDILSRIVSCDEHSVETLQELILGQIAEMLRALCRREGIDTGQIGGCCITGNTTMLHIFAGISPHGISVAPFIPASLFGCTQEVDFPGIGKHLCYLPPCISAYVGGDITCSILASGMMMRKQSAILIDIGTNGEIALLHDGKLYCCATAAGPAFEGANISCGMCAQAGAIDKVWAESGELKWHILGDARADGICGSGLIDTVYAARSAGLLDRKGRPASGTDGLAVGNSGVVLSRKDLSELLLAKAAIRGGIETLLHVCGLPAEEIAEVVLCGGFGSYLDIDSAAGIGLVPKAFRSRTVSIGNAAGGGAGMLLQNRAMCAEADRIVSAAETVELSSNPYFTKAYVKFMNLNE